VPVAVSTQLVRLDVPIMIGVSFLLLALATDGHLSRWECAGLALGIVGYVIIQVVMSRRSPVLPGQIDEDLVQPGSTPMNIVLIIAGLVLLVLGSGWLVQAAVEIAQLFGVTELVIGLTIVAAGTSMPELATSVIAGLRGQREIAVGNIIGSCIFNILAVLGIAGAIAPGGLPVSNSVLTMDIPVMIAVAVLCFPIFFGGYSINRWQGLLFLGYYGLYTTYLILDSGHNEGLAEYREVVLTAVLPLTLITVLIFNVRTWLRRRRVDRQVAG
jgi:cation:H+ antiporter